MIKLEIDGQGIFIRIDEDADGREQVLAITAKEAIDLFRQLLDKQKEVLELAKKEWEEVKE